MKFDIDDFQVKDTESVGFSASEEDTEIKLVEEVKESDIFNGEIIYTEAEEELAQAEAEIPIDLGETKVIPSAEIEELLNSDVFKEAEKDIEISKNIEEPEENLVSEESEYEFSEGNLEYSADAEDSGEESFDSEAFEEAISLEEQEELEGLGDLNYHDEDEEPVMPVLAEEEAEPRIKRQPEVNKRKAPVKKAEMEKRTNTARKSAPAARSKSNGKRPVSAGKSQSVRNGQGKPVRRADGGNNSGKGRPVKEQNKFKQFVANLSFMDIGIAAVGVALLVVLIVAGNIFLVQKAAVTKVGSFASIGNQLENLTEIGNGGIKGIVTQAADNIEIIATNDKDDVIPITVTFTSVEKDLKIKFENKYEETLIEGIAFEIDAVGPDKKEYSWVDEDKDGIIYQEKMTPGEYLVTIKSIEKYNFPDTATKVTVKDKITYTAINIVNEIKTEDQIDVAKEDTEKEEIDEEPLLKDTVKWVESTKKAIDAEDGFAKLDKLKITDPETLVAGIERRFWCADTLEVTVNETTTCSVTLGEGESAEDWSSSNTGVATVSGGTVTGVSAGEATISYKIYKTEKKQDPNDSNNEITEKTVLREETFNVTVKAATVSITGVTLSKNSVSLKIGGTETITATVEGPDGADKSVAWSTSDASIVTVDGGKITAVKAGTATITCTTNAKKEDGSSATASCTVTVTDKLALSLNAASATVLVGEEYKIVPTVTGYKENNKVTYSSSNANVATVNGDGVVTGIAVGTAEITVTTVEKDSEGADGKQLVAKVAITVKANPRKDTVTLLKDAEGKQVYIKNAEGKYVEAKWADYYTATVFYIKSETIYQYTGWQTINNKTYYYDENGKAVTGEQVIQGMKYNFASDGSLSMNGGVLGIDVSKWNGNIDWKAVKNSGISFVIIRCGYRGSSTGVLVKDPKFDSYVSGANSAGLKVGLYFFSQAISEVEAVEEASMAISLARNYKISYPVFIDTEKTTNGRANNISKDARTAVCKAFCETVKNAGYTPGIYASKTWFTGQLNMSTLNAYKIWLAQYASQPTYAGRYDLWQHSSKGSVSGISGNVDLDISYLGY